MPGKEKQPIHTENSDLLINKNEDYFRYLYEQAPLSYQSLDEKGMILDVNNAWLETLGYQKTEVIGKWFGEFLAPGENSKLEANFSRFLAKGEIGNVEFILKHKNGQSIDIILSGKILNNRKGQFLRTHCILKDMTKNKKKERELYSSENLYRATINSMQEIIYIADSGLNILMINNTMKEWARKLEISAKNIIGKNLFDLFPFLGNKVKREYEKVFKSGKPLATSETSIIDGEEVITLTKKIPIFNNGEITKVITVISDITEFKKVENKIKNNERKQKAMLTNISDVIAILDENGVIQYKSPNIEKVFGWKPEDLIGTDGWLTVHPEDLARIQSEFGALLKKKGSVRSVEYAYKCKNGSYKPIRLTAINLLDDPVIQGLLMNYHDISEQKKSYEKMKINQQRWELAQIVANIGNWEFELSTGQIWGSEQAFKIYGIELNLIDNPEQILPLDQVENCILEKDRVHNALVNIIQHNKPYDLEYEIIREVDGEKIMVHSVAERVLNNKGELIKISGTIQNITKRKQAEEQLKQLNERFVLATDAAKIGVWDLDLINNKLTWDNRMFQLYGIGQNDFEHAYEAWQKGVHPDDLERADKEVQQAVSGEKEFDTEFRILRPDKEVRYLKASAQVIRDQSGLPVRMIGVNFDITDRKLAEKQLLQNQYYLRKAQEIGKIGSWKLDIKNNILTWSEENYRIFGVTPGKPLTYNLFLERIHPDDRNYVHQKWQEALNHQPYDIEHRLIVDGQLKWVREKAEVEFDDKGNAVSGIGFTQDITEFKLNQIELNKHQENLEELVKERTQKLAARNQELEMIHKNMIGREFRIKELREQVQELRKRLGEA